MQRSAFFQKFEANVRETPDAVAIDSTDGLPASRSAEGLLTYRRLDAQANALAAALGALPVPADRPRIVGLAMDARADYVAGMLGIGKAGAAFAPLPPDLPALRLRSYLERAAPYAVVCPAAEMAAVRARLDAAGQAGLPLLAMPAADAADPGAPAGIKVSPGDPAYVMFTSGSTGEPKAILGQQRGLSHFLAWEMAEFGMGRDTRGTWLAPVSFDVSLRDVLVPLMAGGTLCIPHPDTRVTPHRLVDWIAASRASLVHCVPSALRLILRELEARGATADAPAFPALRHLLVAGEPLYGADVADWRRLAGGPAEMVNLYGPSETTLAKLFLRIGDEVPGPRQMLPIGRPLPNTEVAVLDGDYACAPGDVGEIHIRTPYRSLGYLGAPEMTAAAFIQHPLFPGAEFYRTGDLGRQREDGVIECLGRLDNQVKINGIRIEPGEVETALRRVEGVRDAAVAVHDGFGQGKILVGYYTRRDGATEALPQDRLEGELRGFLPEALLPRIYVPLAEMPRTVSGKINRKALPQADALFYASREYVAPEGETEETLARLWSELFGLARIGAVTPFRDFGGDSLKAIKALSAIYHACGIELTLREFFDSPTIRDIARLLEARRGDAPAGRTIPRLAEAASYPASPAQRRLWRLHRMGIAPTAYNLTEAYRVDGALDTARLDAALRRLVARHESLRTTFAEVDAEPRQVVGEAAGWELTVRDLRDEADAEAAAEALTGREREFVFDLENGPLLRVTAAALPAAADGTPRTLLVLVIHHIIADLRSLQVLSEELAEVYQALGEGREPALSALPLQYRDFAAWQNDGLSTAEMGGQRDYWRKRLTPPLPVLTLPYDRPRPSVQTFNGSTERVVIEAETLARLKDLAAARGVTLFALLIALTGAALYRYSGQRDIVIGSPVLGRDHRDLDNQVGYYVNTVALRLALDPAQPFAELLDHAGERVGEALQHQSYPFDSLVEDLALPRDMSRSPVFDVMVVGQTFDEFELSLPGLAVHPFGADNAWNFSRFDLVYHFQEMQGALVLDLNYNSDLFNQSRIRRACAHMAALAQAAALDAAAPLGRLSLMPAAEASLIAAASAGPETPWNGPATIPALFAEIAARHAGRPALVEAGRSLSFAETAAAADRLARHLRGPLGVAPGDRVAVLARRSIPSLIALLAVMQAGAVYVPVDPDYPAQRIALMLERAECRLALADEAEALAHLEGTGVAGHLTGALLEQAAEAGGDAPAAPAAEDTAYIIFTSGSTGLPKAVEVAHGGFVNMSLGQIDAFGLGAEDRVLQFASPSFDASLANIFMALFAGGAVVLPSDEVIRAPDQLLAFIETTGTTCITLPPTYLRNLGNSALPGCLRVLISAGEAAAVAEMVHHARQGLRVFNAYGPTEASVCATVQAIGVDTDPGLARLPIGKPLPNTTLRILDGEFNPVPLGVTGEIFIGGAGVAKGYRNDPDRTAAAFITHPRSGERLYRTGDLGRWLDDGTVDFLGRDDDQVKLRGFRLEMGEIEQALRSCPGVSDACVDILAHDGADATLLGYYCPEPKVELWPSIAEFYVYDDIVHTSMERDEGRNRKYREAFARHLPGTVVVDIGTGPFAVLARLAVEAGARKVYAIELLESSFHKATATVRQLGLEDRITVVHGDARSVRLPEKADWCISEIVGSIGGAEGAAVIIEQARPLLKDPSRMLPRRSLTRIAACSLPEENIGWGFSDIALHYLHRIFDQMGRPFDLRLCVKTLPEGSLISNHDVFEDLDYTRTLPPECSHSIALTVNRAARLTGFAVWLTLDIDHDLTVDILESQGSWLPIYIPAFPGGVDLAAGDRILATITRSLDANGLNPDFRIEGQVETGGRRIPFSVDSPNAAQGFAQTPFYQRLFAEGPAPRLTPLSPAAVRRHLAERLPAHAIPHRVMELEALPLTVNGKVDRAALPKSGFAPAAAPGRTVRAGAEAVVAEIWREVLGLETVGADDDFFAIGGDSIRAIQVVGRLRQRGYGAEVRLLFQYPRLAHFAANLPSAAPAAAPAAAWTGPVPLSPIQSWFFRRFDGHLDHFNQAVQVIADGRLDRAAVTAALDSVWRSHDMLRARFTRGDEGWTQSIDPAATPLRLEERSVRDEEEYGRAADALHGGFRLGDGRLFAALLAHFPDHDRLLLAAHHLVVDVVSWGIITEDLQAALAAAERGEEASPPAATGHYGAFAETLARHARQAGEAALAPWRALPAASRPPATGTSAAGSLTRRLDAEDTFAIKESGVSPQTLLLASLAKAVGDWSGAAAVTVDLEVHGRDLEGIGGADASPPDLSRSVGWFTSFHPLAIALPAEGDALAAVEAAIAALPAGGRDWLALAEFADPALRGQAAWIGFNYLGQLGSEDETAGLRIDWTPPGQPIAADAPAVHGLEVLACILDGQLEISFGFDGRHLDGAAAERLADALVSDLRDRLGSGLRAFTAGILDRDALSELLADD